MTRSRVLLVVTVYNGEAFVPRCVESAAGIDKSDCDIDVLVLDDCSPDREWSVRLAALCEQLGAGYYWTPRNLGIVRNVNLGLLHAVNAGYSHVIIANSDVIFPANCVAGLLAVANSDERIGSVTSWSNNVSIYSLPNEDPDANLADQGVVSWLSASLGGMFGASAMDIPAGISFCILIPTKVIEDVGIMDTVYGRGYCARCLHLPHGAGFYLGRRSHCGWPHYRSRERSGHRPSLPNVSAPSA
jgi:GT2 family glycosyltransferase